MRKHAVLIALLLSAFHSGAAAAQGRAPEPGYLDDRSTPEAVISSYYDAVNRREYARAYSYWEPGAAQRADVRRLLHAAPGTSAATSGATLSADGYRARLDSGGGQ